MAQANKIHLNEKDSAYTTEALARKAQEALSVVTEIVPYGGGFALRETGTDKPAGNTPYTTEALARKAQEALSVVTEIVPYGGGFALRETGTDKPAGNTQTDSAQTGRQKESRPASRPDRNALLSAKRERRKEMGARDPLEAFKIPGMVTRWVRDTEREGGRKIHQKLKRGWDFVELREGVPTAVQGDVNRGAISDRYVTMPGGNGATMYLMAIEQELFQEDHEESKETQDRKMEQMRKSAMHPDIEGTGLRMTVTNPTPR